MFAGSGIICNFVCETSTTMTETFHWLVRNVELPALDYALIERWLAAVARNHDRICGELNYQFCDDPEILDVNRRFLGHDYYTDIITFDNTRGRMVNGDIVISLDTVRSNAAEVGSDFDTELLRVIVHGMLHLCGINDKGPGEREIMERHENDALKLLPEL